MLKYIEPFYFFMALFIGMFLVYISTPVPDIVIKYPLPDEVDNIVYKDEADTCYKYNITEVNCGNNNFNKFDIQYVDNDNKNSMNIFDTIREKVQY